MQQVRVHRVRRAAAAVLHLDGYAVRLRIGEQLLARGQVPLAPRREHADVRLERVVSKLETDLVVALAGCPVRDGIGAGRARDLDLALGDQRPRNRGPEQVLALVDRIGAEHRKHEITDEFLAQILDEDLLHAGGLRLRARGLELLALADVGGERHHFAAIGVLQPAQDDRRVEAAGISEDDLHVSRSGRRSAVSPAPTWRIRFRSGARSLPACRRSARSPARSTPP